MFFISAFRNKKEILHNPVNPVGKFFSVARGANLFSSAKSAEENVCACLRPSATKITIFHLSRLPRIS
jgi:hypothetical protein